MGCAFGTLLLLYLFTLLIYIFVTGLNNTALPPTSICTIEDLCGFGGFKGGEPNQSFRFITAIFLHAGLVHILVNMFVQLTLSSQVSFRFFHPLCSRELTH